MKKKLDVVTPGKLSSRRVRRKIVNDTNVAADELDRMATQFMMNLFDAGLHAYTYEELFRSWEKSWREYAAHVNKTRSNSRHPIHADRFTETFRPLEQEMNTQTFLKKLRDNFINPFYYEIYPESDQPQLPRDEEADEGDQALQV